MYWREAINKWRFDNAEIDIFCIRTLPPGSVSSMKRYKIQLINQQAIPAERECKGRTIVSYFFDDY